MIKTQKFISIILLMFGTAFVCTVFGNYFIDLSLVEVPHIPEIISLYESQLMMIKIICLLTSGCLGTVSLIVVLFTINRFINENISAMGILKAIGYSNVKISMKFLQIGLYVFVGAILGYAGGMMTAPYVYDVLSKDMYILPQLSFHMLPVLLIIITAFLFSFISFAFANIKLKKPVLNMLKKVNSYHINVRKTRKVKYKDKVSYLKEFKKMILSHHKILLFFVGFSGFGFSAQIQLSLTLMGSSMMDSSMTGIVTGICMPMGILLGSVTLLIAGEFIINSNKQNISIMKAFGYTDKECSSSLLDLYRLPACIGFMIGTLYQYGLIKLLISLFAENYVIDIPFNVLAFGITFVAFIIGYECIMYGYKRKLSKVSLKQNMEEN